MFINLHLNVALQLVADLERAAFDERAALAVDQADQLDGVAVRALRHPRQGCYHLSPSSKSPGQSHHHHISRTRPLLDTGLPQGSPDRSCAIRIHRVVATLNRSSLYLVGNLPLPLQSKSLYLI